MICRQELVSGPTTRVVRRRTRFSSLLLGLVGAISSGATLAQIQTVGGTLGGVGQLGQFDSPVRLPVSGAGERAGPAWQLTPYIASTLTLTDNVALAPSGEEEADLVLGVTPGLRIRGRTARTRIEGFAQAETLFYANTGGENNTIYPQVSVFGNVEAIEKFFYIDGAIEVAQEFLSPFGSRPADNVNVSANRATSASYQISPYVQGLAFGDTTYYVRDENVWTNLSNSPIELENAYYNNLVAQLFNPADPGGWTLDYNRSYTKFKDQQPLIAQLARFRPIYRLTSQLEISGSGGYETRDYPLTEDANTIYGVGARWRPTERTNVVGAWEHRYFGSSYLFTFDHRMPSTALSVQASRNVTTYARRALTLGAGGNVTALLNAALTTRIPDPAQRQQAVETFIQQAGLPSALASPVSFYSQQVLLEEIESATFALLGIRNVVAFSVYHRKSEEVFGAQAVTIPGLELPGNFTERGSSVTWSNRLTGLTALNAIASYIETTQNAPFTDQSQQWIFQVGLTSAISPKTSGFATVRYQKSDSDFSSDYREAALIAGLNHQF